ncbi:MAG: rRNA (guanosine2251-2-O)-methyltransferase [Patescibacteria group bacterium]|jgi:23S rRNA (guanosine2251-2'-O)-methyltransferase|nr:rRNA (guanosine2251-2-O)-methyltransferase [Patescibacteria group bacterium]
MIKKTLKELLKEIENKENACIVVLDELTDVHNVGAIIRTAVATGADAVVVGKHNQAPINDTVMRTSAYTADMIPIIEMNINDSLRILKDNDFWVHGLFMKGDSSLWNSDLKGKVAIVVGSEGDGIHDLTRKLCDFALAIPMDEKVESLNASVSAGIALYERLRQIS